jgi:hypothetical protein
VGLRQYVSVECDSPGCPRYTEIDLGGAYRDPRLVRHVARDLGWLPGRAGRWFCPGHSALAFSGDTAGPHKDWCPLVTRRGACACRDRPEQPLRSSVPQRKVQTVRVTGGVL